MSIFKNIYRRGGETMGRKLSIRGASELLDLSEHFLRKCVKNGELPFIKAGSKIILDVELVEETLRKKSIQNMQQTGGDKKKGYGIIGPV